MLELNLCIKVQLFLPPEPAKSKQKNFRMSKITVFHTTVLASVSMVAFAANSILCRTALLEEITDPFSFTIIRIFSGALLLTALVWFRNLMKASDNTRNRSAALFRNGSWISGLSLVVYAMAFSYAYISLDAGMGALLLFAIVQVTMIGWSLIRGVRIGKWQLGGVVFALVGLGYLTSPGLQAPPLWGCTLMIISGMAWAIYTLKGKGEKVPTLATTSNFLRAAIICLGSLMFLGSQVEISTRGLILAIASGALTSGLGYVIWYIALTGLTSVQAGVIQLSVPVIAAIGGFFLLGEVLTTRFLMASVLILGGIAITLYHRNNRMQAN